MSSRTGRFWTPSRPSQPINGEQGQTGSCSTQPCVERVAQKPGTPLRQTVSDEVSSLISREDTVRRRGCKLKQQCVATPGRADGWRFVEVDSHVQGEYLLPRPRVEGVDVAIECPRVENSIAHCQPAAIRYLRKEV